MYKSKYYYDPGYKDYTFLTEVQVPIVSTKECKTAYSSNKKIFDYDKTLCAGYPYLGSDSCRVFGSFDFIQKIIEELHHF